MGRRYIAVAIGALALLLGGVVATGWAPDLDAESLRRTYANDASRFVAIPGGARLHYRVQGAADGVPFVLLHGSNASLHTWEPWVAELGDTYRIVTLDLPGHGLTGPVPDGDYTYAGMARAVIALADALSLPSFVLGGSSMGGGVSLQLALSHPERVRALVLLDPAGLTPPADTRVPVDRPLAFRIATTWWAPYVMTSFAPRQLARGGLEKSFADPSHVDDAMVDRYWELARYPGSRQAMVTRFRWYVDGRRDLDVARVAQPALILWGEEDRLIPVETGALLHARMPDSELVTYPGVGHLPMEEIPSRSAADARAFLDRRLSSSADAGPASGSGVGDVTPIVHAPPSAALLDPPTRREEGAARFAEWKVRFDDGVAELERTCGGDAEITCDGAACVVRVEGGPYASLMRYARRPTRLFEQLAPRLGLPAELDRCGEAWKALQDQSALHLVAGPTPCFGFFPRAAPPPEPPGGRQMVDGRCVNCPPVGPDDGPTHAEALCGRVGGQPVRPATPP